MSKLPRSMGALICAGAAACAREARPLRVGATYTLEQSGALALLDSLGPPARVAVVVGPSGQILRAAARGDLDVVIAHAPALEARLLIQPGAAVLRCPLVTSRFAIAGPAADPAHVAAAPDAADAFRRIARAGGPFVSRGDSSGTHVRELALWRVAGVEPRGAPWYVESGVDQSTTLHIAGERHAYALADLPTLARLPDLDLAVLLGRDTMLVNAYTLYVVPGPRRAAADSFAAWAKDRWTPSLGTLRLPGGDRAFDIRPEPCDAPGVQ